MSGIFLCAALALGLAAEQPLSYTEAYSQSQTSKRPLLVLVSADWCPACRDLKNSTLARMQKDGKLKDVVYTVVNIDQEHRLAERLMRSTSIPQLVLFTPASEGWYRFDLQGFQDSRQVASLIERGLAMQQHGPSAHHATVAGD